jgi:hypothetical protein
MVPGGRLCKARAKLAEAADESAPVHEETVNQQNKPIDE